MQNNSADVDLEESVSTTNPGQITDINNKRPQFGTRILTNGNDVFKYNAWDNVEWDAEQEQLAKDAVLINSSSKMLPEQSVVIQSEQDKFWNSFYGIHRDNFFKNREWLFTEFPELCSNYNDKNSPRSIFEIGCGVGNTIIPLLRNNQKEENLTIYGCDFSERAIEILRSQPQFDEKRCNVFVMDATLSEWHVPFAEESQDIIILIFVLSAIEPKKMKGVIENCYRYLKPGGIVLLRDYGRYDLTQLRFKSGKCLDDNLYVRGDGTMVYFFTQDELRSLFNNTGFIEEQNVVDRRLQVNRGRMIKMYRVWLQTKYRKPAHG